MHRRRHDRSIANRLRAAFDPHQAFNQAFEKSDLDTTGGVGVVPQIKKFLIVSGNRGWWVLVGGVGNENVEPFGLQLIQKKLAGVTRVLVWMANGQNAWFDASIPQEGECRYRAGERPSALKVDPVRIMYLLRSVDAQSDTNTVAADQLCPF